MLIIRNPMSHNLSQEIEQAATFKHLGAEFSEDGRIDDDLNSRISSARKVFEAVNKKLLGNLVVLKPTKGKLQDCLQPDIDVQLEVKDP